MQHLPLLSSEDEFCFMSKSDSSKSHVVVLSKPLRLCLCGDVRKAVLGMTDKPGDHQVNIISSSRKTTPMSTALDGILFSRVFKDAAEISLSIVIAKDALATFEPNNVMKQVSFSNMINGDNQGDISISGFDFSQHRNINNVTHINVSNKQEKKNT